MTTNEETGLEERIRTSDPLLSRCFNSQLLVPTDENKHSSNYISTADREVYGDPSHPIQFRIANGGAGFTGLLKLLSDTYIESTDSPFRIAWVSNHSRHSQLALLAGVVHIALTYEPENEDISLQESWAERVLGRPLMNDHFLLAGPRDVDLLLQDDRIEDAFRAIADSHTGMKGRRFRFHSRGDGSATFAKEQKCWKAVVGMGLDFKRLEEWIETHPLVPYDALRKAEDGKAFLLTDRSTYLTAKRDGVIPSLKVHVEGAAELMNPCSALVGSAELVDRLGDGLECHTAAREFAEWLGGERAQELIRDYGVNWPLGKALFTVGCKDEFDERDRLVRRC